MTFALGVLLGGGPAVQAVSRLLPSQLGVVSGHGVSVVDVFVVVVFQSAQPKRLQDRRVVTTAVLRSLSIIKTAHLSGHAPSPRDSSGVS